MSNTYPPNQGQGTAGGTDVVTQLQGIVRQLAAWVKAFSGRQTFGSFTLAEPLQPQLRKLQFSPILTLP